MTRAFHRHDAGWLSVRKTVFFDPRYPCSMAPEAGSFAGELARSGGFHVVDAVELSAWMEAWTDHGAENTVCFLAHGAVPDTIAASPSRDCLARSYMEFGGRLVWIGDTPFYYQASPGRLILWGMSGQERVLDLAPARETPRNARLTEDGLRWGLVRPGEPGACVAGRDVSVTLVETAPGLAASFFKNFSTEHPTSGFLRLLAAPGPDGIAPAPAELARTAAHLLDFGAEEERGAPAEAYPDPGGALVESGTFRVDRDKALEKLQRFQLPDPYMYLLPFVRCAAASDARSIRFSRVPGGLEMRFEGSPLEERALEDPYHYLLEGGEDAARYRHLAVGLLAAFRLEPKRITIASGGARESFLLTLDSPKHESVSHPETVLLNTAITVVWDAPFWRTVRVDRQLEYVQSHCDPSRCEIRLLDRALESEEGPEPGFGRRFDDEGVYGWVEIPENPAPVSKLEAYSWGVRVGPLQLNLPMAQVRGRVNDDSFGLNASQTGVTADKRLAHLAVVLARQAEGLLLETLDGLAGRLSAVGSRMAEDGYLRRVWARVVEPVGEAGTGEGPSRDAGQFFSLLFAGGLGRQSEDAEEVSKCARIALWLRSAAERTLWDREDDAKSPVLAALWDAPLYFDLQGCPLSLRRIVEAKERNLGLIRFATRPCRSAGPDTVWRLAPGELAMLSSHYGDALTDVTEK